MTLGLRRVLTHAGVIALLLLSAASGVSRGNATAASSASPAASSYQPLGVSGVVAARALNALAQKQAKHTSRQAVNVQFILNWLPNVEFAGLWTAQRFGWWRQAGVNMSYTPWSASVHPETDVPSRAGNTFGFQSGAAIAIAASKGVPIRALYADAQKSVFGLTVLNNSRINKITDLRGKRVGYQPHELYVPQTMLAAAGLKPSEWKAVPVGFDIVTLTAHRVDAQLTFLINEPITLDLQGVKNHSFRAADYGFHFYDDVLFTYNGMIQHNPALVRKVVSTVARGFQYAHLHPDQIARMTVRYYFPAGKGETAVQHLRQQILELRKFSGFSKDSRGQYSGVMSTAYWRDSIDTLYKYREITSKPNPGTIYTNRFNPLR